MRRTALIVATGIALLSLPVAAVATPIGGLSYNIGGPGFSVSSGVGFTLRDVHVIKEESIIDESSSSRFLNKLNVAPVDYLDVYALFGAADYQLADADYRGRLAPMYGGGVRPMILPYGWDIPLNVSADVRYLAFTTSDHKVEGRYQEFQAALIIAYKAEGVMPYGGLKYNPIDVGISGRHNDLEGEMDSGLFIGCDWFVTPNVFFAGELAIFSETSAHLMVGYNYPTSF